MTLRYRADVDGLRAVAVAAVILYHFEFPGFSGGFVGVDVFFVISGFLIASLIDREIEERRFALANFYERRIRRIFPALIVLLIVVSIPAYVELFPAGYRRFGQSLTATITFLSNVEFWREGESYFNAPSRENPLLHTWSLAVEEQFYLLFPPLLVLLARYPRRWAIAAFTTLIVISLGVSIWSEPQARFYLFPSRMWELLLGVLIAVGAFPIVSGQLARNVLSAFGLAIIACTVALCTPATAFPGIAALLACAGAALIIYAGLGDDTATNRMLSARPIVFVGLISYSLYLWHWPLYVFATHHQARDLSLFESLVLIAASFMIATLSWRFVEQPFRRPNGVASRRYLFLQAAAATLIFAASGTAIYLANGVPQRFSPDVQALLAPQTYFRAPRCEPAQSEHTIVGPMCRIGRLGGPPMFLVWGDSHARALGPAVSRTADRLGYSGLITTLGGCAPLLGRGEVGGECRRRNDAILNFAKDRKIELVILGAQWAASAEGTFYDPERVRIFGYAEDDESQEQSVEETRRVFVRSLNRTVSALRANGQRVVIAGPVPEISVNVPMTLARRRVRGLSEDIGPTLAQFEARNRLVLDTFLSMDGIVELVYPHQVLCTALRCAVARDGKPFYVDATHLDRFGSEMVSAIFEPVFSVR